jgi:hypothetical protein
VVRSRKRSDGPAAKSLTGAADTVYGQARGLSAPPAEQIRKAPAALALFVFDPGRIQRFASGEILFEKTPFHAFFYTKKTIAETDRKMTEEICFGEPAGDKFTAG